MALCYVRLHGFSLILLSIGKFSSTVYVAPSSLANDWEGLKSEYHINFHSESPGKKTPHATLFFEPFAEFLEDVRDSTNVPEHKFMVLAQNLVLKMSCNYTSENNRREDIRRVLRDKFDFRTFSSSVFSKRPITSDLSIVHDVCVDGTTIDVVLANMETKNGLGQRGKDADFQNVGYYLHFSSAFVAKTAKDLAPMLLISLVGRYYIAAFAAFRNHNGEVCIDPLSPPYLMIHVPDDPLETTRQLALFFQSAHQLIGRLKSYYDRPRYDRFPYFRDEGKFVYDSSVCRSVFVGLHKGRDAIIKFTRTYGLAVHQHLANKGMAPTIYSHCLLKCGWHAIIMEFNAQSETLYERFKKDPGFKKDSSFPAIWRGFTKNVLELLKEKNFVHGDLRMPNLIVDRSNRICVLDFDWSGEEGIARYPETLNTIEIDWPESVVPGGVIEAKHDAEFLDQITSKLKY